MSLLWLVRIVVVLIAIGFGYWIGAQHYGKQLAIVQRDQASDSNTHLRTTRATEQQQQTAVSAAESEHWKALNDAQHEVSKLRADLAAGTRRVYVNTTCAKRLSETASSSSVDHAATTELAGTARQSYLDFRAAYATQRHQLMACQAIIHSLKQ